MKLYLHLLSALLLLLFLVAAHYPPITEAQQTKQQQDGNSNNVVQVDVKFVPNKIKMDMDNSSRLDYIIFVNRSALTPEQAAGHSIVVEFKPITLSPQFDIIEYNQTNSTQPERVELTLDQLRTNDYTYKSSLYLKATYIGHATIECKSYWLKRPNEDGAPLLMSNTRLVEITVIRHEGILDKIFMYSVIIFITISYINLGAQIDTENVRKLIDKPKIIFLGFLIGVVVMPSASWIAGHVFFKDQPMYRIGSFIYACGPAASASVLWTVMFKSDKELSLGLQIASTVGALMTMPILLYAMDKSIDLEGQYTIKVPYMNLARTLIVLLVALLIGSRLVGYSDRAKRISQRIFRPLTMMFDWTITMMALIVTTATYLISGFLGYIIHRDFNHMITISISSTYRNSGIAFAALVVAFQPPDIFIAYVPCLTQVVTTSLIGLVLYFIKSLKTRCSAKDY